MSDEKRIDKDKWEGVDDSEDVSEDLIRGTIRKLRIQTIFRDWMSMIFDGFSSILGGLVNTSPAYFVPEQPDKSKDDKTETEEGKE